MSLISSLQRLDPKVSEVLLKTGHVVRYSWDGANSVWIQDKMEGPFHLIKRTSGDFSFCILNRVAPIDGYDILPTVQGGAEIEISLSKRFVIFRSHNLLRGVWFASSSVKEMKQVETVMKSLGLPISASALVPTYSSSSTTKRNKDSKKGEEEEGEEEEEESTPQNNNNNNNNKDSTAPLTK